MSHDIPMTDVEVARWLVAELDRDRNRDGRIATALRTIREHGGAARSATLERELAAVRARVEAWRPVVEAWAYAAKTFRVVGLAGGGQGWEINRPALVSAVQAVDALPAEFRPEGKT